MYLAARSSSIFDCFPMSSSYQVTVRVTPLERPARPKLLGGLLQYPKKSSLLSTLGRCTVLGAESEGYRCGSPTPAQGLQLYLPDPLARQVRYHGDVLQ